MTEGHLQHIAGEAINDAVNEYAKEGHKGSFVDDYLMENTHHLFDPISDLICITDRGAIAPPAWRHELEDIMVDRWESFSNEVAFALEMDCYDRIDQEVKLLFSWLLEVVDKYSLLLAQHIRTAPDRDNPLSLEPPF